MSLPQHIEDSTENGPWSLAVLEHIPDCKDKWLKPTHRSRPGAHTDSKFGRNGEESASAILGWLEAQLIVAPLQVEMLQRRLVTGL